MVQEKNRKKTLKDKESESNTTVVKVLGMRLLKCPLAFFGGDPLKWALFIETFDAAVDS